MEELILIQSKLRVLKDQSKSGIQFQYRTTDLILEKVKPLCVEYGVLLIVSDKVVECGGFNYIESTATVSKGDKTISCTGLAKEPIKLMAMSAPQITGSCSSYARKTALGGLFAIDNNDDPDSINNNSNKKSKDEVDTRQQIINALGHPNITETKRQYYRDEMKVGNIGFNDEFLTKLKKEHNIK
jgi:hypothetical protein